jgi:hypothetical protein
LALLRLAGLAGLLLLEAVNGLEFVELLLLEGELGLDRVDRDGFAGGYGSPTKPADKWLIGLEEGCCEGERSD